MILVGDAVADVHRDTHEAELKTMSRVFADVKTGVDPVRWTVCHLGCFGFLEHLHLTGNRG